MWLALRRFRSERWWDRKAQAYTELFQALFYVQRYARLAMRREARGLALDDEFMRALGEKSSAGYAEILKAATIGSLLFGDQVATRLSRLEQELDEPDADRNYYEELMADYDAVTAAIGDLRPLARADLKLK